MTDIITLAATAPAIVALTNLARELGLPSRAGMLLAVTLGIALSVADYALTGTGWYEQAVAGLMLGLAAAGLHDLAGRAATPRRALNGYQDAA